VKVVTSEEMLSIEQRAIASGVPLGTLIERAGRALSDVVAKSEGPVLILAGPGNNGADGETAARLLAESGRDVTLYTFRRQPAAQVRTVQAENDPELAMLARILDSAAVIVDALLGTGQSRPVEGLLGGIVEAANAPSATRARVAADVPTGVNADTGAISGAAFRADITVAMGYAKVGDMVWPGAGYAGRVIVADLQLPAPDHVALLAPEPADIARLLPGRPRNSNKGTFGRTLVIGGSERFPGAPALTSLGALRIGTGLVQAAVPASIVPSVASHAMEVTFLPLPGEDGALTTDGLPALVDALAGAGAVAVGPGLSLTSATVSLVRDLLPHLSVRPALVDADGLNALARIEGWWRQMRLPVLTPHPGEMSRLTGLSIEAIQSDRLGVATKFAAEWGSVVVLKGAGSIVAASDGRAAVITTGGPNLATAGTGDVLSGIIGGLLAQGMDPWDAAVAGTYIHGAAGDRVAGALGSAGTLAGDLLPEIPVVRRNLQERERTTG